MRIHKVDSNRGDTQADTLLPVPPTDPQGFRAPGPDLCSSGLTGWLQVKPGDEVGLGGERGLPQPGSPLQPSILSGRDRERCQHAK